MSIIGGPLRRRLNVAAFALVLAAFPAAMGRAEEPVTIYAAASLTAVLGDLAESYVASGNPPPRSVFASSSILAKQIEQGAPADLYIAANPAWMDYLESRALTEPGSRVALLGNRLVLIAPLDSPLDKLDIAPGFPLAEALDREREGGRLALGDPSHVPAGQYAQAALQDLAVWEGIAPRAAFAADVRAALALVERAAAVAGIVYASDAQVSRRVRVLGTFPEDSHPPIRYPLAILAGRDKPAVRALYDFLQSPEAAALFSARGFIPPAPGG